MPWPTAVLAAAITKPDCRASALAARGEDTYIRCSDPFRQLDGTVGVHDLDGQRVDTALELGIERLHHGAMLCESGLAGKLAGPDSDAEMGLAAFTPTRVTMVAIAFVDNFKMGWREFLGKFLNNRVANGHRNTSSGLARETT